MGPVLFVVQRVPAFYDPSPAAISQLLAEQKKDQYQPENTLLVSLPQDQAREPASMRKEDFQRQSCSKSYNPRLYVYITAKKTKLF